MDKQYALVYVQEVIPHVLVCFEHVYAAGDPAAATTAATVPSRLGGARKQASASVGLKVENLVAAKENLTAESYAALSVCWTMLRKAELLPAERIALPPAASSSLPPTRPQVNTGSSAVTSSATATAAAAVSPTNAAAKPPPAPPSEEELETNNNNNNTLNSNSNQSAPAVATKEESEREEWVDDF